MQHLEVYGVAVVIAFFWVVELLIGVYGKHSIRSKTDWLVEMVSFWSLIGIIKPVVFLISSFLLVQFLPSIQGKFADWSLWLAFPFVILIDDVFQYWYHRKAHDWPWLWKLHRTHHVAREMGVFVAYRNASLYYLLMPNIYWLAICTHLGMAEAVAISIVFKQLVVSASHSPTKWDQYLYRYKALASLAWIIERVISTPSTHFAHHGMSEKDGISNPNGNFSNTFFIWDIMFGTAQINRKYPIQFGIENDPEDPWYAHVLYPFVKSKKEGSELAE
jgi:sterol desaturase/sphingolipid hydroxylase (fatty acid hydroxylase superfamily)